jgi:peptide chain release factor 2
MAFSYDNTKKSGVYLSVLAGAGGDDAKDWAQMLLRMYGKFSEKKHWKYVWLSDNALEIKGEGAFPRLRPESGVHRLVRISPYDAKKLRHTSFALVEVLPVLPPLETSKLVIPENDLKIEFTRSSGPGGQNVNKVETAVRIVHLPTGIVVSAQAERSQNANREHAMEILKTKLIALMRQNQETELKNLRTKVKPEWGHEIRSYVLHPYKQVKDHATGKKYSGVEAVLEGDLDILN